MLLTKEVEIKVHPTNIKYLENLGYEIPMRPASEAVRKAQHKDFVYDIGATILIKVEDAPPNSNAEVEVLCDYCKEEVFTQTLLLYTKATKNFPKSVCKNCIHLKIEEVNMLKYGVPYTLKIKEFREKGRKTMQEKYGVSHYSQSPDFREKYDKTCKERYGESYYQIFTNKAFETFKDRTGYDYPSQSPEVREKVLSSVHEKYGVENISQSEEIKEKKTKSFYKHGSISTSSQQVYLHNLYGGELNFPLKFYNLDICFTDEKLCVEYSGGGHDLSVKMGYISQEEFKHKEIVRCAAIKNEGYKLMEIISEYDYLPSDDILLQMLEYTRKYFSDYPQHSWIRFNIDSSTVRNAEQKKGVFFDYGALRRINKSA